MAEFPTFDSPGPAAIYDAALAEGKFRIQKCDSCGEHIFYPRALCHHCGAAELTWVDASGAGTVHSTTIVRQRPDRGGDYNICLVDLAEGPRLMSRVVDTDPADVTIGMAVEAFVGEVDGETAVLFRPAAGA